MCVFGAWVPEAPRLSPCSSSHVEYSLRGDASGHVVGTLTQLCGEGHLPQPWERATLDMDPPALRGKLSPADTVTATS